MYHGLFIAAVLGKRPMPMDIWKRTVHVGVDSMTDSVIESLLPLLRHCDRTISAALHMQTLVECRVR